MKDFDLFSLDAGEAKRLILGHYNAINYRWRWNYARNSGIPVSVLNNFVKTGEIDNRHIPVLYHLAFGDKSPEDVERGLTGMVKNG